MFDKNKSLIRKQKFDKKAGKSAYICENTTNCTLKIATFHCV